MNEKIKLVFLGIIALTLIVNTYYVASNDGYNFTNPTTARNTFSQSATATADKITNPAANNAIDPMAKPAQAAPKGPSTSIKFKDTVHDFGNIKQDTENRKVFTFTNTGSEPLVIENAKGSCGCTVPKYPKEPIPPGGTGDIEVVYKPGKQKNQQTKTVTITANTEPENTILTIKANVEEV